MGLLHRQPDVFAWKVVGNSYGMRGIPDVCGTVGAAALFWEIKTAKGQVSPSQQIVHEAIRRAGGTVSVVRSLEDAEDALRALRGNPS